MGRQRHAVNNMPAGQPPRSAHATGWPLQDRLDWCSKGGKVAPGLHAELLRLRPGLMTDSGLGFHDAGVLTVRPWAISSLMRVMTKAPLAE